jgi:Fur family ferric uptake transcriptional regulator
MTSQRKVILEELRGVDTHPTADRIYEMVRRRLPRISLGTVYRNLETLAEQGLIRKYESAGSQRRYDGDPSNHYHVRCLRCGRLDDVPLSPVADVEHLLKDRTEYEIVGHRLEFEGICPDCRRRQADRETAVRGPRASADIDPTDQGME